MSNTRWMIEQQKESHTIVNENRLMQVESYMSIEQLMHSRSQEYVKDDKQREEITRFPTTGRKYIEKNLNEINDAIKQIRKTYDSYFKEKNIDRIDIVLVSPYQDRYDKNSTEIILSANLKVDSCTRGIELSNISFADSPEEFPLTPTGISKFIDRVYDRAMPEFIDKKSGFMNYAINELSKYSKEEYVRTLDNTLLALLKTKEKNNEIDNTILTMTNNYRTMDCSNYQDIINRNAAVYKALAPYFNNFRGYSDNTDEIVRTIDNWFDKACRGLKETHESILQLHEIKQIISDWHEDPEKDLEAFDAMEKLYEKIKPDNQITNEQTDIER